jgi:hypothetical protein
MRPRPCDAANRLRASRRLLADPQTHRQPPRRAPPVADLVLVGPLRAITKMKQLKLTVFIAAVVVLAICVYTFLLGNKVFDGQFSNDAVAWYFLAKGVFCSLSLYLSVRMLEVLSNLR